MCVRLCDMLIVVAIYAARDRHSRWHRRRCCVEIYNPFQVCWLAASHFPLFVMRVVIECALYEKTNAKNLVHNSLKGRSPQLAVASIRAIIVAIFHEQGNQFGIVFTCCHRTYLILDHLHLLIVCVRWRVIRPSSYEYQGWLPRSNLIVAMIHCLCIK